MGYKNRAWRLAGFIVPLLFGAATRADTLNIFKAEYPAAAEKLERAYRQVKMVGTLSRTSGTGEHMWTVHIEMLRDDDLLRLEQRAIESVEPRWPVGAFEAEGGSTTNYFVAEKLSQDDDLTTKESQTKELQYPDVYKKIIEFRPVFAPYSLGGSFISDYIKRPDVRVTSASETKFEGQDVVEVDTEEFVTQKKLGEYKGVTLPNGKEVTVGTIGKQYHIFFQPHSWLVVGFVSPGNDIVPVEHEKVSYEEGGNPSKIKSVDYWVEFQGKKGAKQYGMAYELTSVDFSAIPAKEFTIEAVQAEKSWTDVIQAPHSEGSSTRAGR